MKRSAFEVERFAGGLDQTAVAIAKSAEVLTRLRRHVAEQLKDESPGGSWNREKDKLKVQR